MWTESTDFSEMTCPGCIRICNVPKILKCGHLLCWDCLKSLLTSTSSSFSLHCPSCGTYISSCLEWRLKSQDDLDHAFPTDRALEGLVQSSELLSRSHVCHKHEAEVASSMCLQCEHLLCKACESDHLTKTLPNQHIVKDLATLTPRTLAVSRLGICPLHRQQIFGICSDHRVAVCPSCIHFHHRSCPRVTDLQTVRAEAEKSFAKMKSQLSAVESLFAERTSCFSSQMDKTESIARAGIEAIDVTFNRLQECLETCRKRLKELIQDDVVKIKQIIDKTKKVVDEKLGSVTSHRQLLERVQNTVSSSDITYMATVLKNRTNEIVMDTKMPDDPVFTQRIMIIDMEMFNRLLKDVDCLIQPSIPDTPTENVSVTSESNYELWNAHGDLFTCPFTDSLAHCVSEDLAMFKGIADGFKKKFQGVEELLAQGKVVGEAAILKRNGRFVYYLITKPKFSDKPTYATLRWSLESMRKHCLENGVTSLCIPEIGCGRDGLDWEKVSEVIKDIFKDTGITITVYIM